jgi:hypothetical protein
MICIQKWNANVPSWKAKSRAPRNAVSLKNDMFKLPGLPSPQAECHELADFVELLAWQKGSVSSREIIAYLGRVDENDNNIGCDDNDDQHDQELDEVMNEVERRATACGSGYPFALDHEGLVVRYNTSAASQASEVYLYLLLCTRLNMKSDRTHAGIDGAALFEEVSSEILRSYLGRRRARSMVFGTAAAGRFEDKVNNLCRNVGEGGCFRALDATVDANDDKLDTVTWLPFSDNTPCQLVIFGQCKTGSNWAGLTTQLRPDAFIKRWMNTPYLLDPVRAFCISEAANRAKWSLSVYTGLLFDRCRLVDFCDEIDPAAFQKVQSWNAAAKATLSL